MAFDDYLRSLIAGSMNPRTGLPESFDLEKDPLGVYNRVVGAGRGTPGSTFAPQQSYLGNFDYNVGDTNAGGIGSLLPPQPAPITFNTSPGVLPAPSPPTPGTSPSLLSDPPSGVLPAPSPPDPSDPYAVPATAAPATTATGDTAGGLPSNGGGGMGTSDIGGTAIAPGTTVMGGDTSLATTTPGGVSPVGDTGGLGFGEGLGVDWFTGANANLLTDPTSKYNPDTAVGKAYYAQNPREAAMAVLLKQYGPLSQLGDNFRAFATQTANRAAAQQALREQLAGPGGAGDTYQQIAQSLASGDIYGPATNRNLLGQLVTQASGGNRLTQQYLTDPTNRRDILNAALWSVSPSNPYFDYLQRNLNQLQQGSQVGGTWLSYLRQMGVI